MADNATTTAAEVRLTIPARTEFVRLARLNAASLAASCGWGVDEVEDLRLAINEATTVLTSPEGDDPIDFVFATDGTSVTVTGTRPGLASVTVDDLVTTILGAIVDDHEFDDDGASARFSLRKGAGG